MARSVVLLIIGAIAGSAGVYLLGGQDRSADTGAIAPAEAPAITSSAESPVVAPALISDQPPTSFAAERLAAYALAAQTADVIDLESLIRGAVREEPSRSRDLKLSALLARLAEIDPRYAIEVARNEYLETAFFVSLYEIWAQIDPDSAIADLANVRPASEQRALALAVLQVIGNDSEGVSLISAVLQPANRPGFEIDALVAKAGTNPAEALQALNEVPLSTMKALVIVDVAEAAARLDPLSAMALATSIDDFSLRESWKNAVLNAWADIDPEGVFVWLERASFADIPEYSVVYRTLAINDAERMLALVDTLPPTSRTSARNAALQALAQSNPEQAIAMLESTPPGQDREQMIQAIAQAYGRQNPDLALEWVRQLSPPSPNALGAALQGIAEVDPVRAVDLMVDDIAALNSSDFTSISSYLSLLLSIGSNTEIDTGQVLNRLIDVDNSLMSSVLGSAIGNWARRDAAAALEWAIANSSRLEPNTFRNIASAVSGSDPAAAINTLSRLPPEQQAGWIEGMAAQLVQSDPNLLLNLVDGLRGGPGYTTAYSAVARAIARVDPPRAAQLLSSGPALPQNEMLNAVLNISREWAGRDPRAAARWASGLEDPGTQGRAMSGVVQQWAQTDSNAAKRWLLNANSGQARDTALGSYVSLVAQAGQFDPELIDAFSNEQMAQQAASNAIVQIGRADLEEARRLLDQYITDPAMHRRTEENLARTGGTGGSSSILLSSGVILQ